MNEWHPLPQEIIDLFDDANVSEMCRDKCITALWGAKRAIMYGRQSVQARRKAWGLVHELYPELDGETIEYQPKEAAVRIKPSEANAA